MLASWAKQTSQQVLKGLACLHLPNAGIIMSDFFYMGSDDQI